MNRRSFFKALCALPAALGMVRMLPKPTPVAVGGTMPLEFVGTQGGFDVWQVHYPSAPQFDFAWSSEPRGARITHDVLEMIAKGTGIPRDVLTADVQVRSQWESVGVPASALRHVSAASARRM